MAENEGTQEKIQALDFTEQRKEALSKGESVGTVGVNETPESSKEQSINDEKKQFDNSSSLTRSEKWMVCFTAVIALATVANAFIAYYQWDTISDGSKDTKAIAEATKQQAYNTKILAQAALEQAKAAKIQADTSSAAAKSAEISAKAAQMGVEATKSGITIANRAYISIDKMRFLNPLEANKPAVLIFEFVNDGNSSAEINGAGSHFLVANADLSKCRYGDLVFKKIMVSPKSPRTQRVEISRKRFSVSELEDIQQGRRYFQVCVKITYTTLNENYPYENCSYYFPEMKTFLECKTR